LKRLAIFPFFVLVLSLAAQQRGGRPASAQAAPSAGASVAHGVVTNGTTNKPAARDDVILLRPGGDGMVEVERTKSNAKGEFTLQVPADGMPVHAIRVRHNGVEFLKPLKAGEDNVQIAVYESTAKLAGVRVQSQSEVFQTDTDGAMLVGVEDFVIQNDSNPKMAQPDFEFYLPEGVTIIDGQALSGELLPVKRPPVPEGNNKYKMLYPLRPGMTQFWVKYSLPYTGSTKINSKVAENVDKFYLVTPKSFTLNLPSDAAFHAEEWPIEPGLALNTQAIDTPAAGKQIAFDISGSGTLPDAPERQSGRESAAAGRPGGGLGVPNDKPTPLNSDQSWYFLGVMTLFLAGGGTVVYFANHHQPAAVAAPVTPRNPQDRSAALLEVLKEEMFQLESDRLKGKLSQPEYDKAKAALDNTLQRAMKRQTS
jgi:hypothetical protein